MAGSPGLKHNIYSALPVPADCERLTACYLPAECRVGMQASVFV